MKTNNPFPTMNFYTDPDQDPDPYCISCVTCRKPATTTNHCKSCYMKIWRANNKAKLKQYKEARKAYELTIWFHIKAIFKIIKSYIK